MEKKKPISEVHNIDCIEYMRTLPDNYFDLAVCDPPYGMANSEIESGGGTTGSTRGSSDTSHQQVNNRLKGGRRERYYALLPPTISGQENPAISQYNRFQGGTWATKFRKPMGDNLQAPTWDIAPPKEFFDELFRVSKEQIIWGGNYFELPPTRCFLVWEKTNIAEKFTMAMCEYAWTSFKGNAKLFKHRSLRDDHSGKFHPTEKPQALYGWILRMYAKDGMRIFDPMMGSQSSRIAAYKMGIDYYGCEIDPYYFERGNAFFERECHGVQELGKGITVKQLNLFDND